MILSRRDARHHYAFPTANPGISQRFNLLGRSSSRTSSCSQDLTSAIIPFPRTVRQFRQKCQLAIFATMSPKSKSAVLWLLAIILLATCLWTLNLTMFNWWASGGPPVEHPEIYRTRGNIFFAIACALLLGFSLVLVTIFRRRKARQTKNGG